MFQSVGELTLFATATIAALFRGLPSRKTLLPNFYQVGVLSLPVVAITGTFIGMVLAVQSHFQFGGISRSYWERISNLILKVVTFL